jgi:large subunit ribosomal protein L23
MSKHLNVIPLVSEKAYASSKANIYAFTVPVDANKQQIASAVNEQFGVKVDTVNVIVNKGKPIRSFRGKRAYPGKAVRTTVKKAYVRLAEGESIKVFEEEAKEEKK